MAAAKATKVINDNVLGRIELFGRESEVAGTRAFLRLSHLSQLGLGRTVFPGATHTRLSHSLGVMHLVGRVSEVLGLPHRDIRKLRLVGLLHDIGQYPLSHCIENVYRMIAHSAREEGWAENPESIGAPSGAEFLQQAGDGKIERGKEATDKNMGAYIIRNREDLRHALGGRNAVGFIDDVAAMVAGETSDPIHQAILNSDYDCDRLDYLQRDSQLTGVPYGQIDMDFLIENMVRVQYPPTSPVRILAVKRKGLGSLEHYLLARYYMYSQVVFHKTVRAFELLAKATFLALARKGAVYPDHEAIKKIVSTDEFLAFTDSYFYEAIDRFLRSSDQDANIRKWATRLLERRTLYLAYEARALAEFLQDDPTLLVTSNVLVNPANRASIASRAGLSLSEIVVDYVPPVELVPFRSQQGTYVDLQREVNKVLAGEVTGQLADLLTAPWLYDEKEKRLSLLADDAGSILRPLREKKLFLIRLYTTSQSAAKVKDLHEAVRTEINMGTRP
jgi:uncharacterized protein